MVMVLNPLYNVQFFIQYILYIFTILLIRVFYAEFLHNYKTVKIINSSLEQILNLKI